MDDITKEVVDEVITEMEFAAKQHPIYPTDPVRRAAIMLEEAGEVIKAALELTRGDSVMDVIAEGHLYEELKQTAAMALRNMVAIRGGK